MKLWRIKFTKVTSQEKNVNSLFVLGFNLGSCCDHGRSQEGGVTPHIKCIVYKMLLTICKTR